MKPVHEMSKDELVAEVSVGLAWSKTPPSRWSRTELENEVRIRREENDGEPYDPEPRNPQNNTYSGEDSRYLQDMRDTGRPGL